MFDDDDDKDTVKVSPNLIKRCVIGGVVGVLVLTLWLGVLPAFLHRVDPGNVGMVISYATEGKPSVASYQAGNYVWTNPFGGQAFIEYPTTQENLVLSSRGDEGELQGNSTIPCVMSGGGTLNIGMTVNWQVDPVHPEVLFFKKKNLPLTGTLNGDVASTVVYGAVRSDTTTICSNYTWQDILGDGTGPSKVRQMQSDILVAIQSDLRPNGILVNQIFINEKIPSAQIQAVLDAQTKAQQSAYLKIQAQNEANAKIAQAQGDAQAIEIINKQLSQSPQYIQYLMVKEWDGHLPQYLSTNGNSNPVLAALGKGQ